MRPQRSNPRPRCDRPSDRCRARAGTPAGTCPGSCIGTQVALVCASLLVAALGGGCRGRSDPTTLTVSAAVSMKEVLSDVARAFEAEHPNVRVALNTGASGDLARQVEAGAPVDVIATADDATMDRLAARALIRSDSRRVAARSQLVLVARTGALPGLDARALATDPRVGRVAVGDPASVPAGRYAASWLRALGVWEALGPRLVYAGNVRQVLDYVARGEADAGVVYVTDVGIMPGIAIVDRAPIDAPAIRYPIAVVSASPHADLARAFVEAATSDQSRALYTARRFLPP